MPLVLWEAEATEAGVAADGVTVVPGCSGGKIAVDHMLVKWLRPHQREGVQFMFECVTGLRMTGGLGEQGWGLRVGARRFPQTSRAR